MRPPVWVLVINCNGAAWLPRCLNSLLATRYPTLHVVLIDNGSRDDSVAVARAVSARVEILQNAQNLGFCQGNNAGIDYALRHGAAYIALLNNDTYVEPDWAERLVEVGEVQASIGILGPVQLVFEGKEFNSWTTSALPHLLADLRAQDRPGAWLPVDWVEGSGLVAKRAVFERIGRLDPIFFTFYEEIDLCRRARAAGFQVAIVPASKIHHYRGGYFGQPRHARQRRFLFSRNAMIYSSTDPSASLGKNLLGLARNNATQLKAALLAPRKLAVWLHASCAVLARLPAIYRKWTVDRRTVMG